MMRGLRWKAGPATPIAPSSFSTASSAASARRSAAGDGRGPRAARAR
jgi:hypothetical protein